MSKTSLEQALRHSLEQALGTTDFVPEDLPLADVSLSPGLPQWVDPEAPAAITAGLNSVDLSVVCLAIYPPGQRLVAGVWEDTDFTSSVWLDLRPAEALELSRRLQVCGEAAARFAEAFPEEPDEADRSADQAVDP